jgi:hypothetical protein
LLVPETAWIAPDFRARASRPLLGPGLWLFGTALWAYVIVGQLVVARGFPEPLGILGVLFAFGVGWYFAIELSFATDPPAANTRRARILLPAAIACGLWLGTTLLVTLIGVTSTSNIDAPLSVGLWLFSLVPFFIGRRLTRPGARPTQDPARRFVGVLLWIGASIVTLVALGSLFD